MSDHRRASYLKNPHSYEKVLHCLMHFKNNKTDAARYLGISRQLIYYIIKKGQTYGTGAYTRIDKEFWERKKGAEFSKN